MSDFNRTVQRTDDGAIKVTGQKIQTVLDGPLPDLLCDSVSASKSKCGNTGFLGTGKFLTYSTHWTWDQDVSGDGDYSCTFHASGFRTSQYNDDCTENTGSCNCRVTFDDSLPGPYPPHGHCEGTCCLGYECGGCVHFFCGYVEQSVTNTNRVYSNDCTGLVFEHQTVYFSESFSDEFTTDLLKDKTESALPDYSGCWGCIDEEGNACDLDEGQGCGCSASYNLSEDESSLTIQNFKYKFKMSDEQDEQGNYIDATPPNGVILKWVERFTPDDDPDNYVDNKKSFTFDGSARETDEYDCNHPDSNGEITIERIRWS